MIRGAFGLLMGILLGLVLFGLASEAMLIAQEMLTDSGACRP